MRLASVDCRSYTLPFARPLTTARGRFTHRHGYLLGLRDAQGRVGWGDAAPWPGFGTSSEVVEQALERCKQALIRGALPDAPADVPLWLGALQLPGEVAFAVEVAVVDLLAQTAEKPMWALLPALGPPRPTLLGAVVQTPDQARRVVAEGFGCLKIKVGHGAPAADVQRLRQIRAAVGAAVDLRADANGAWDLATARRFCQDVAELQLQWLEQPVAADDLAGLKTLRQAGGPRIAADESVAKLGAAVISERAADVVVLKPMFLGGLFAAVRLAEQAQRIGLAPMVSYAWESAVGRNACLHLATALGGELAAGLDSPLAQDVASTPPPEGGKLAIPTEPGLGVRPTATLQDVGA